MVRIILEALHGRHGVSPVSVTSDIFHDPIVARQGAPIVHYNNAS